MCLEGNKNFITSGANPVGVALALVVPPLAASSNSRSRPTTKEILNQAARGCVEVLDLPVTAVRLLGDRVSNSQSSANISVKITAASSPQPRPPLHPTESKATLDKVD